MLVLDEELLHDGHFGEHILALLPDRLDVVLVLLEFLLLFPVGFVYDIEVLRVRAFVPVLCLLLQCVIEPTSFHLVAQLSYFCFLKSCPHIALLATLVFDSTPLAQKFSVFGDDQFVSTVQILLVGRHPDLLEALHLHLVGPRIFVVMQMQSSFYD